MNMALQLPIGPGLTLKIGNNSNTPGDFPTARLQKGFLLLDGDWDLAEEGVGFGVPIVMRGLQTIFPGGIRLDSLDDGTCRVVRANYSLNIVEKIGKAIDGGIKSDLLYTLKNFLAALIRGLPIMRGLLTGISNLVRNVFGWETIYEPVDSSIEIRMTYKIDALSGTLDVTLESDDLRSMGVSEIVVMNEQGARNFSHYSDSSGITLTEDDIGCWDEVKASEAAFICPSHKVAFELDPVAGSKLFRGRELIGSRLAWAGFGYTFPSNLTRFSYTVKIRRLE
jgi:hypothetical protein